MKKKGMLYITIASILIVALFGCGGRGKAEKKVIVYSPHGGDILKQLEELFEKKYPDIDVEWMDMGSPRLWHFKLP